MKPATLLLAALLVGCASTATEADAAGVAKKAMTVRVLQQGAYAASSNPHATVLIARDAATYERLWNTVIGSGKAPAADFAKESVLFLVDQQRNTGGYSIAPDTGEIEGSTATIKAAINRPQRGNAVTQVLTVPYAVVAVPKTNVTAAKWVDEEGKIVAEDRGAAGASRQK